MNAVCRMCMGGSPTRTLVDLFDYPDGDVVGCYDERWSVADILNELLPDCKVQKDDVLPNLICTDCVRSAHSAFWFQRKCLWSYGSFCQLLTDSENDDDGDLVIDLDAVMAWLNTDNGDVNEEPDWELIQQQPEVELSEQTESEGHQQAQSESALDSEPTDEAVKENEPEKENKNGIQKRRRLRSRRYTKNQTVLKETQRTLRERKPQMKEMTRKSKDLVNKNSSANAKQGNLKRSRSSGVSKVCPHCKKHFRDKFAMECHRRVHNFKCKFCQKSFSDRKNLQDHTRLHTRNYPFKCTDCAMSFLYSRELKHHMRVHTGERPYKCSFCPKAFKLNHDRIRHTRLHTGEKPHQCPHCVRAFSRKDVLLKHMRSHTEGKKNDQTVKR